MLLVALGVLASLALHAEAEDRRVRADRPAWITDGEGAFIERMKCPDPTPSEQTRTVFCRTRVEADGSVAMRNADCFSQDATPEAFVKATRRALDGSSFAPARSNGEAVAVDVAFRVVFPPGQEGCHPIALPNFGLQTDDYGATYFAPQRIFGEDDVQPLVPKDRTDPTFRTFWISEGVKLVLSVQVDDEGVATDGRVDTERGYTAAQQKRMIRTLESARYVTGFHEGQPAPMRHYEFVYHGHRHERGWGWRWGLIK